MNKLMHKIKKLCKSSYPQHNWGGHLIPVVEAALKLQEEHGGDREIIEAGAYLHDIGRVKFNYLSLIGIGHDLSGYYYSRYKLWLYGAPKEKIERISRCVLTHQGNGISKYSPNTLEEEIVMNADAVAQFEQYFYLFAIHYSHRKSLEGTKKWVLQKLKRDWDTKLTLPNLKGRLQPVYDKIKQELS